MKKKIIIMFCAVCILLIFACVFAACDDATDNTIPDDNNTSYTIQVEKTDDFADFYTISTDYAKVGEGKTVTVAVDAWDFLNTDKVYANDVACTAGTDGKYTFTMPEEDVTVHAEFSINIIPEGENGIKWVNYEQLTTAATLSSGIEVDFGSEPVLNSVSANADGYSTMTYVKVYSMDQDVIPDEAITRIQSIVGSNGAYATGARISFDVTKVKPGKAVLVFIDTDNDRVITAELNVV